MSIRIVSRRALKRMAARLLPEAMQQRIRGRFYGHHDARVETVYRVSLTQAGKQDERYPRVRGPRLNMSCTHAHPDR